MNFEKIRQIKTELKDDPGNVDLWVDYAKLLFDDEVDLEEAIRAQIKVQELTERDTRLKVVHLRALNGEMESAISLAYEVVRENDSELSYVILIDTLISHESYGEANQIIEVALNKYPDNSDFHYYLGVTQKRLCRELKEGEVDHIISSLQKAILLDPNNLDAYDELGTTLFDIGRHKEGLLILKKNSESDQSDGWLKMSYANRLWQAGYIEEADKAFRAAINSKINDERFKEWYQEFLDEREVE